MGLLDHLMHTGSFATTDTAVDGEEQPGFWDTIFESEEFAPVAQGDFGNALIIVDSAIDIAFFGSLAILIGMICLTIITPIPLIVVLASLWISQQIWVWLTYRIPKYTFDYILRYPAWVLTTIPIYLIRLTEYGIWYGIEKDKIPEYNQEQMDYLEQEAEND